MLCVGGTFGGFVCGAVGGAIGGTFHRWYVPSVDRWVDWLVVPSADQWLDLPKEPPTNSPTDPLMERTTDETTMLVVGSL